MKVFIKFLKHLLIIGSIGYFVIYPILHHLDEINPLTKELSDFRFTDIYFGQFKQKEIDNDIVLVDIGYKNNSTTREELTNFLNSIKPYKPKVIALDVDFKYDPQVPDTINYNLIQALNSENLVMYYNLKKVDDLWLKDASEIPIDYSKIKQGYTNCLVEKDTFGVLRFFQPFVNQGPDTLKHFSVVIAEKFGVSIDPSLKENKKVMINFGYKYNNPRKLSDTTNLKAMNNKIIIIGLFTKVNGQPFYNDDLHYTSSNKHYLGKSFPNMYGGEVLATIISNIKANSFIEYKKNLSFILNICLSFLVYFLLLYMKTYFYTLYGSIEILTKFFLVMFFIFLSIYFVGYKNIYIDFTMVGIISFFAVEFIGPIDHFIKIIENKLTKIQQIKK